MHFIRNEEGIAFAFLSLKHAQGGILKHTLIDEILEDHKKIKALYEEGLSESKALSDKKMIFQTLSSIVIAHSKSEEAVAYAPTCGEPETKHQAFEGFEEHGLVDLLMEEARNEENPDRWEAKFTVLCDLLKHHVEEEEEEYLPLLQRMFKNEDLIEMGKEYREMNDRLLRAQKNIYTEPEPSHLRSH